MRVHEIMTSKVECIGPELSLRDAAKKMKALDVGFLPICENDRLIGALTDRDIVVRAVAAGKNYSANAREAMTKEVYFCFEEDSIEACADHMRDKNVKRLLVLNKDKRLVGVVSLGDVSKAHETAAGETLKQISAAA